MPESYTPEDAFILAKRAEWAGDVDYFRRRLIELRELTGRQAKEAEGWHPLGLLSQAAERLGERLASREAPPQELVVETGHLRGVVWQTGRREFELLAYLKDLLWEETLYRHAHAAAAAPSVLALEPDDETEGEEKAVRQGALFQQVEPAPAVDDGPGVSWEEDADGLLCAVTVGDLGLIKIRGTWIRKEVPQQAEEIVERFRRILGRVEAPDALYPEKSNDEEGRQIT